jgi:hypothetical protein
MRFLGNTPTYLRPPRPSPSIIPTFTTTFNCIEALYAILSFHSGTSSVSAQNVSSGASKQARYALLIVEWCFSVTSCVSDTFCLRLGRKAIVACTGPCLPFAPHKKSH